MRTFDFAHVWVNHVVWTKNPKLCFKGSNRAYFRIRRWAPCAHTMVDFQIVYIHHHDTLITYWHSRRTHVVQIASFTVHDDSCRRIFQAVAETCFSYNIKEVSTHVILHSRQGPQAFCRWRGFSAHYRYVFLLRALPFTAMGDLHTMEGALLENLKEKYRTSLDVTAALDAQRCCACGATADLWYSSGGEKEYRRTGICEKCFDTLFDDTAPRREVREQCHQLTDAGCEVARQWLTFSRVRERLTLQTGDFRRAVQIALGQQQLPAARRWVLAPACVFSDRAGTERALGMCLFWPFQARRCEPQRRRSQNAKPGCDVRRLCFGCLLWSRVSEKLHCTCCSSKYPVHCRFVCQGSVTLRELCMVICMVDHPTSVRVRRLYDYHVFFPVLLEIIPWLNQMFHNVWSFGSFLKMTLVMCFVYSTWYQQMIRCNHLMFVDARHVVILCW